MCGALPAICARLLILNAKSLVAYVGQHAALAEKHLLLARLLVDVKLANRADLVLDKIANARDRLQ